MNCPNDRYVNDAAIRQAVAANLARIGVTIPRLDELTFHIGHIPLHQQALAWGCSRRVSLVQLPRNLMLFKRMTLKAAQ